MSRLTAQELSAARKTQDYKLLWEQAIPVVKFAISRLVQSGRIDRSYCSDDMYQAAYLAVGASVRSWEPDKVAFSTWIVTRAQGAAMDHLRRQFNGMVGGRDANGRTGVYDEELTPDTSATGMDVLETTEELGLVTGWWQQLDRYDRNLVALRFGLNGLEPYTMAEIARSNGEPLRTTERRIQSALKKLAGFAGNPRNYNDPTEDTLNEHDERTGRGVVCGDGQDDPRLAPDGISGLRRRGVGRGGSSGRPLRSVARQL